MDSKEQAGAGQHRPPPPLPPRQGSQGHTNDQDDAPPPYELVAHQQRAFEKATAGNPSASGSALGRNDPRSSSQESLVPEPGDQNDRRTLLLIYIHGFMGNETSFRSFPAHLHNLLAVLLAETHVIHSKIYPRYRSKGHITHARDGFSKWLQPHESYSTDIVLLGHSMGGLLSAEVVLMPAPRPASQPLNHRILGTINFDVPFLGMHPGVVKSGLSSIFKSSEETPGDKWEDKDQQTTEGEGAAQNEAPSIRPSRSDTFWDHADANFNPKFTNDVILPVRKGWQGAMHFVSKHATDGLIKSTKKLISSHMEFGGAMANYGELKTRYSRIRALEEEDEKVRGSVTRGGVPPRVRFVNYYTASTGRPKKPRSPSPRHSTSSHGSRPSSRASNQSDRLEVGPSGLQRNSMASSSSLKLMEPTPDTEQDDRTENVNPGIAERQQNVSSADASQPDERQVPSKPPPLGDLSYIQDSNVRKMVEEDHQKAVERYEQAVRENTSSTQKPSEPPEKQNDKGKSLQKPESEMTHMEKEALRLEKERQRMEAEARRMRGEKEPSREPSPVRPSIASIRRIESRAESFAPSTVGTVSSYDSSRLTPQNSKDDAPTKPKKDRKFCTLPPKDSNGERDPCWERVFMKDVDEVGAHCGLFFVDERYERLVGDVAERIERWVNEENGLRVTRAMHYDTPVKN